MSWTVSMRALVAVAIACAVSACGHATSSDAEREAVALLDEVAGAVAPDLGVTASEGPVEVARCAWMANWPTSKRAWEVSRSYDAASVEAADRVARTVAYAQTHGGGLIYDRDEPLGGRDARVSVGDLDVFANAGTQLELRVRSRCFEP